MTINFQTFEGPSIPFEITSFSGEDVGGNHLDGLALVIQTGFSHGFLIGRRVGSENGFYERALCRQRKLPTDGVWGALKGASIADVTDEPIDRAFDDLYDSQVLPLLQKQFPSAVPELLSFLAPSEEAAARRCAFAREFPMLVLFMDRGVLSALDEGEPVLEALNRAIASEFCATGLKLTQAHIDGLALVEWGRMSHAPQAVSLIARLRPDEIPISVTDGACAIGLGTCINEVSLTREVAPSQHRCLDRNGEQPAFPFYRRRLACTSHPDELLSQMDICETPSYYLDAVIFDPMFKLSEALLSRLFPGMKGSHLLPTAFRMLYGTEVDLAEAFRIGSDWYSGQQHYVDAHRTWNAAFDDFKCDETGLVVSVLTDTEQLRAAGDGGEDTRGYRGFSRPFVRQAEIAGYGGSIIVCVRDSNSDGSLGERRCVALLDRKTSLAAGLIKAWIGGAEGDPVDPGAERALDNCLRKIADGSIALNERAFREDVTVTPYDPARILDVWRPHLQPALRDLSLGDIRASLENSVQAAG